MEKTTASMKLQISQLPTMFTDAINIATRMDGSVLLQAMSGTPDRIIENFRTIMTKDGATLFLENLAKSLDHYPVKEKPIVAGKAKKATVPSK